MVSLKFDKFIVDKYLGKYEYVYLANYLKETFKLERDSQGVPQKYEFKPEIAQSLFKVMKVARLIDNSSAIREKSDPLVIELFRALRNYSINPETRDFFFDHHDFLTDIEHILGRTVNPECIQVITQFLINMTVSSQFASNKIFKIYAPTIINILKIRQTCIYEASALLYNISLYQSLEDLGFEMYKTIFKVYEEETERREYLNFLITKFVSYSNFWDYFNSYTVNDRILILETIKNMYIENKDIELNENAFQTLTQFFIASSKIIFQTVETSNDSDLEPFEVSLLLDVLASLCAIQKYLDILQKNKDFFINIGIVLINIHRLGKLSDNYFSSIQKLAEIRKPGDSILNHPAFGFKVSLIRILGNLCWKNKANQNLAREAELIPIILDCCNIDARNPLIMQWVIFTIRNICEKNQENQDFIASLHQKGTVSSATLEEMGLTLHSSGENSIKIVPLDSIR